MTASAAVGPLPGSSGESTRLLSSFRKITIALLAVCLPVSIAASNVALVLAAAALLVQLLIVPGSRRFRATGLEIPWAFWFGTAVLACGLSADPAAGLSKLASHWIILTFLLAAQGQEPEDASRNMGFFLAALTLAALWGAFQFLSGADKNPDTLFLAAPSWMSSWPAALAEKAALRNGRATGFYSHPLTYAEVLLLGGAALLGAALSMRGKARWWAASGAVLSAAALAASGSRGVWLSIPLVLLLWALAARRRELWILILGGALAGGAAFAVSPSLRHRTESISRFSSDPSIGIRLGLWGDALRQIKDNPLWGVGPGQLRLRSGRGPQPDKVWTESHNIFLQAGLEGGLIGLGAFIYFLFAAGRFLWRRSAPGWREGAFFGFLALVLAGLSESWFRDAEVMMCLYFILGCAAFPARKEPK